MKKSLFPTLVFSAVLSLLPQTSSAQYLRWMGLDMNTFAQDPTHAPSFLDSINAASGSPGVISSLASVPFGPGANMTALTGSATRTSGTSFATTGWTITPGSDTLGMTMNHGISGGMAVNNFSGSEGVFYFYALTAGTLTITYDYGQEETTPTTAPYKASDRGRSRTYVLKNSKGLGDNAAGPTEIVNRDGSRTFTETVGPGDDLIALAFDFEILDNPQDTSIPAGYLTMTFTPVPEPTSVALLGMAGGALLAFRRRKA